MKDVPIKSNMVDCAENIVESIYVAAKDAPIKPSKEAYAGGMEQRCGYVPLKDAQS